MKDFIPFISVRDVVMFPKTVLPLVVGREFTIASIQEALRGHKGQIVICAQKAVEQNDKPEMPEIFSVGCLCEIEQYVAFPDGTMKVLVHAKKKFRVSQIQEREGIRGCLGEVVDDLSSVRNEKVLAEKKVQVLNSLTNKVSATEMEKFRRMLEDLIEVTDKHDFLMKVGRLLSLPSITRKELTIEQMNEGVFLVDVLTEDEKKGINLRLARIQEVLEESDIDQAYKKLDVLLA